jgi:hypothetical protein
VKIENAERLNAVPCQVVTTERLGISYQAEMNYEKPDGSSFTFDTDFFGSPRKNMTPGPFEAVKAGEIII